MTAPAVLFAVVLGCGEGSVVAPVAVEQPTIVISEEATRVALSTEMAAEPAPPTEPPTTDSGGDYAPPYPDRVKLFEPPRTQSQRVASGARTGEQGIVLIGFADLGAPLVLLEVDGQVASLESGEERGGIRVISINPPRAVLQRGRLRWTATLD